MAPSADKALSLLVLANFAANGVSESLEFWLSQMQMASEIKYAPFDKLIQFLLDPDSAVSTSEFNIVLLQVERWISERNSLDPANLLRNIGDFTSALKTAISRAVRGNFVIVICPHSPTMQSHPAIVAAESKLLNDLGDIPGVDLTTASELLELYPVDDYTSYFDPIAERLGQAPYTRLCCATLGTMVARRLHAIRGPGRKVIVVDCDNTLWIGVCGDTDPTAVVITPGCRGLQEYLIKQCEGGRLVCLASKNEDTHVFGVFDHHPDMLLKREHLTAWKINWNAKPDNVRLISQELGLDLRSFVFLDDDTFECAAMRALLPQVLTLQLPQDTNNEGLLRNTWDLDIPKPTEDDRRRTLYYKQDTERFKAQQHSASLRDFLSSLQLLVDIQSLSIDNVARAAQLTQRTNQFNLNGVSRSVAELQSLSNSNARKCLTIRARDRFGEYGIVGLAIFCMNEQSLTVETFLLSCRILGRGIEYEVAAHLANIAYLARISRLNFQYRPTPRNLPIRSFLSNLGMSPDEELDYSISLNECLNRLSCHLGNFQ